MKAIEKRLNDLENEVAVLKNKDSIRTLLSNYAVAVDGKDRASLSAR
jgi:hypothetical protein